MPDNTQYTRCPECSTAFKVSDKMLSMAKGKVRCGACLVVFQATDFILKAKTKTPIAPIRPGEPAVPPAQENNQVSSLTQEPAQSVLDFDESENNENNEILPPPTAPEVNSEIDITEEGEIAQEIDSIEEPEVQQEENNLESPSEVESINNDEIPAFNISTAITQGSLPRISADGKVIDDTIFEESEDLQIDEDELDPEINLDDPEYDDPEGDGSEDDGSEGDDSEDMEPGINIDSDLEDFVLEDFEPFESNSFDEDFQEDISNDIESLSDDEQVIENIPLDDRDFIDETMDEPIKEDSHYIDEMLDIDIIDENIKDISASPTDSLTESASSELLIETSDEKLSTEEEHDFEKLADTLASQINDADTDPDPLDEFEERVEKKKTSLRTGVIIAVCFIILSVLSVKFWGNRQALAWDKTWGPITTSICSLLPCDLKARRDVAKIKLRQRIVEPLENNENRLSIKLLLTNEAEFDQPYPTISISFSSPQGESIAIKRFLVKDYFPEKQNQLMPADAEIHISFETDLPHPNALGFEFNFE